jgi:predicted aspartyl protease
MRFTLLEISLLLGALTCPGPASAQGAWPEDCKLVRMAELPMSFKSGHVMIPVQVDGKDLLMEVDTGNAVTGLTRPTVADLGLVTHRQNSRIILDIAGTLADEYVRVDDFKLDHLERGGINFGVIGPLPEAGGDLGVDVLRNYDADFDFGEGRLSLFRHHPCSDRAVYWTGTYAVLPFTTVTGNSTVIAGSVVHNGMNKASVLNAGHIRVPVTLDGQEAYAVIDTGAPVSVISMQEAGRLFGLSATSPDVEKTGKLTGGAGGQLESYSYPFKTLTIGGVTVTNPRIRIGEGRNFLQSDYASVLLGMDVLQKLHLYIAYGEGKLYMTSADAR